MTARFVGLRAVAAHGSAGNEILPWNRLWTAELHLRPKTGTGTLMQISDLERTPDAHSELDCRVVVHSLLFCPTLEKGTRYCLASRDGGGRRTVLGYGMALNTHPPLNLAFVRQRGAKLGANEVLLIEPA